MESAPPPSFSEWTNAIHSRLLSQWEAWKSQDAAANDAVLMEASPRFVRTGRSAPAGPARSRWPSSRLPATVSLNFGWSRWRRTPPSSLTSPTIETPDSVRHHMAVGEYLDFARRGMVHPRIFRTR